MAAVEDDSSMESSGNSNFDFRQYRREALLEENLWHREVLFPDSEDSDASNENDPPPVQFRRYMNNLVTALLRLRGQVVGSLTFLSRGTLVGIERAALEVAYIARQIRNIEGYVFAEEPHSSEESYNPLNSSDEESVNHQID